MKYLVVSSRYGTKSMSFDNQVASFEGLTICAETRDKELAHRLMQFYNKGDKGQHTEVHPVMEDDEIIDFLNKFDTPGL